jgi:aryl-alcohol dehydrogenase-like predicted oxidoreductase
LACRDLDEWHVPPIVDRDKLHEKIEALIQIAEGRGVSVAEVALAWLLGRPGVTSLIIGARTEDQLRTNLVAAELVLSAEERAHLDTVSAPTLLYPYWHQRLMAAGRMS